MCGFSIPPYLQVATWWDGLLLQKTFIVFNQNVSNILSPSNHHQRHFAVLKRDVLWPQGTPSLWSREAATAWCEGGEEAEHY